MADFQLLAVIIAFSIATSKAIRARSLSENISDNEATESLWQRRINLVTFFQGYLEVSWVTLGKLYLLFQPKDMEAKTLYI